MKKMLCTLVAGLFATLFVSSTAHADPLDNVSLRLEPGVAVPLTKPQTQRFGLGGAVALKPELTLGTGTALDLGLGPSLQVMQLHSRLPGVDDGNAWSYGGFLRLKRTHGEKNTGHGLSAISPWVDGDLKLVHTDPLDRLGAAVAVGAQVPTSESRWLWVGPFVRYDLVNQNDDRVSFNTNSAKTLIAGFSFELGAPQKRQAEKTVPEVPQELKRPVPPPQEVVKQEKAVDPVHVKVEFRQKVQFDVDSAVVAPSETPGLDRVVQALLTETHGNVRVEGHASSEGRVEHNKKLSTKRAQAVVDYLVKHGVPRERLTAVGFGSSKPVADNKTAAGRALNRRVEFDVVFTIVNDAKDVK